jgi:hypothetical protein
VKGQVPDVSKIERVGDAHVGLTGPKWCSGQQEKMGQRGINSGLQQGEGESWRSWASELLRARARREGKGSRAPSAGQLLGHRREQSQAGLKRKREGGKKEDFLSFFFSNFFKAIFNGF